MKTRAAIAHAAGQPLEVTTVDLDGPRAGEVLIELKATGVCHTDEFTRSGAEKVHSATSSARSVSASARTATRAPPAWALRSSRQA